MCGISGILAQNESVQIEPSVLNAMRDVLAHRGPDGAGTWLSIERRVGLAHRRLAIVDLSECANQPMWNVEETACVVFNGEIYNHAALRRELESKGFQFKTSHSDTETLVQGYNAWGIDELLRRLHGMFAFAIWDPEKENLFLARDRLGIKPLYFAGNSKYFAFASEIKSILANPHFSTNANFFSLNHFLTFLSTPAPLTLYEGIYKIPAGSYMSVDLKGSSEYQKYWTPLDQRSAHVPGSQEDLLNQFDTHLKNAVHSHTMSDVPIGVFLSGGVDSSLNTALLHKMTSSDVVAFSVDFPNDPGTSEIEHARRITQQYKIPHEIVPLDQQILQNSVEFLIDVMDEPLADPSCLPSYLLSVHASESGLKVVHVGEGADEIFAGYSNYQRSLRSIQKERHIHLKKCVQMLRRPVGLGAHFLSKKFRAHALSILLTQITDHRSVFWTRPSMNRGYQQKLLFDSFPTSAFSDSFVLKNGMLPHQYLHWDSHHVIERLEQDLRRTGHKDHLFEIIYKDMSISLSELLLMRVDKCAMASSVEARVPFLDHQLVEWGLRLDNRWKIQSNEGKFLLKKLAEAYIPHGNIYRKKRGLGIPLASWFSSDFGISAEKKIMNSYLVKERILNKSMVRYMFESHRNGNQAFTQNLWSLFVASQWYERWIRG